MAIQKKIYIGSVAADNELQFVSGGQTVTLQEGDVTEKIIADNAVTRDKIKDKSVNANKIADGTITSTQISSISPNKIVYNDGVSIATKISSLSSNINSIESSLTNQDCYYARFIVHENCKVEFFRIGNVVYGTIGAVSKPGSSVGSNTTTYKTKNIASYSPDPRGRGAAYDKRGGWYYTGKLPFPPTGFKMALQSSSLISDIRNQSIILPYTAISSGEICSDCNGVWILKQVTGQRHLGWNVENNVSDESGNFAFNYDQWGIRQIAVEEAISKNLHNMERYAQFSYVTADDVPDIEWLKNQYHFGSSDWSYSGDSSFKLDGSSTTNNPKLEDIQKYSASDLRELGYKYTNK